MTPINKKKVIPSSRRSTGKSVGGQPSHTRHFLESPPDDKIEVVDVEHELTEEDACSGCGSEHYTFTGEWIEKDELDVIIKPIKIKHKYFIYKYEECGMQFRLPIPPHLKEQCQYGPNVKAVTLSLMNTINTPINKVCCLTA